MNNLNGNVCITDRQFEIQTIDMFLNFDSSLFDDEYEKNYESLEASNTSVTTSSKVRKTRTTKSVAKYIANTNQVNALSVVLFGAKQSRPKPPSRMKNRSHVLYAFPSYDKCNSLLYFPNAFTRLLNSADFDNLAKLFKTHLSNNCSIELGFQKLKPTIDNLIEIFTFTTEVHPDCFMCVHSTTVADNQIKATIHMKCTDVQSIKDSLLRTKRTPIEYSLLQESINRDKFPSYGLNEQEHQIMQETLRESTDLIVYIRIELVLTLDSYTRKVVSWDSTHGITSVTPVGFRY